MEQAYQDHLLYSLSKVYGYGFFVIASVFIFLLLSDRKQK